MKKFFVLIISAASFVFAQQKTITFEVLTDKLDDTASVFITGNNSSLGDWNAGAVRLNKIEKDKWSISVPFENFAELEYKFTLGSWNFEALDRNGFVSGNKILHVQHDTLISLFVPKWGTNSKPVPHGQVTGTLKYHHNMSYENLLSRDVVVWLPPNYDKDVNERYPVIYAHDGQNLFDPKSSTFGFDWQIDEAADSLIRQKKMEPVIVVGIYNTRNRSQEYMSFDTAYTYMDFIVKKLKPFIDKTYRTKSDRNNTAVMGSSAGGTIAFMLHWVHNDVFGKAASISPAFKIFRYDFVSPLVNNNSERKDLNLYIDDGGVGIDSMLLPGVNAMIKALKDNNYKENKNFVFNFYPKAEHNEKNWAERVWNPLLFMFGKNKN